MTTVVEIYTDGACRGNPGPGGWGVVLRYKGKEKYLSGYAADTTNNRMELMAAIVGLNKLKRVCNVIITTDSEYLQKGITQWLPKWKQQGWRTSSKKPVKNADLWQQLDVSVARHDSVAWQWVRAHSGHRYNEKADELANQAIDELLKQQ